MKTHSHLSAHQHPTKLSRDGIQEVDVETREGKLDHFLIGSQTQCIKTELYFNGFMLLEANNSPHKTHCGQNRPCLSSLQVKSHLFL